MRFNIIIKKKECFVFETDKIIWYIRENRNYNYNNFFKYVGYKWNR